MVWKPKEKELSRDEAIELARKELAPHWVGGPPLLAAVRAGNQATVVPLDPGFHKQAWLIYFIDLTDYHRTRVLEHIQKFQHRYGDFTLRTLMIAKGTFPHVWAQRIPEFI